MAPLPKHMLIDGKLVTAERTYPSVNPSTGEVLGQAPDASETDAKAAVAAARRAFDSTDWSVNAEFRSRCLRQLYAALAKHREELRELTIADVGAPRGSTFGAQLDEPIEIVEYYANLLPRFSFVEVYGRAGLERQRAD
ncbi:MAG TPA: aldehyde dehydrogenase family protein [Trebonia sp.]